MKLLHITAHMGGGAGNAISNMVICETSNRHHIIVLEKPEKQKYVQVCMKNGVLVTISPVKQEMERFIAEADILIIHWWHHPLMADFFRQMPDVFSRTILWCHISGCTYPFLPFDFVNCFDYVFFTSHYSYENAEWTADELEIVRKKSKVVYGLGDLVSVPPKAEYQIKENAVLIGYVGTFTKSKLNSGFVKACAKIIDAVSDVKFIMVGDVGTAEWIVKEAKGLHILDKFEFLGFIDDIAKVLLSMDVFAYPLEPVHFGTTENAILEAMAVGLPVVLLEQATEKYIVKHERNGLLAKDMDDYVTQVCRLIKDRDLAKKIGQKAVSDIYLTYSINDNTERFRAVVEEVRVIKKHKNNLLWTDNIKEYFLYFLPSEYMKLLSFSRGLSEEEEKQLAEKLWTEYPILCENSKSSIVHFSDYYPEDLWLTMLKDIVLKFRNETR